VAPASIPRRDDVDVLAALIMVRSMVEVRPVAEVGTSVAGCCHGDITYITCQVSPHVVISLL
jgi:hypothetical protein